MLEWEYPLRNEFSIGGASQGGLLFTIHEAERLTAWGTGGSAPGSFGVLAL